MWPLPEVIMSGPTYRIKLYGQSGNDPEKFCRDLAAALGLTPDEARAFLKQVPVVIREGVPKERAERLTEFLASINALVLAESEGPETVADAAMSPQILPVELQRKQAEREDAVRYGFWLVALGAVAATFVLFVGGTILWSYLKVSAKNQPTVQASKTPPSQEPSGQANGQQSVPSAENFEERIAAIESRIEELRAKQVETQEELYHYTLTANEPERLLRAHRINELRDEIRKEAADLKVLKATLKDMLRRQ